MSKFPVWMGAKLESGPTLKGRLLKNNLNPPIQIAYFPNLKNQTLCNYVINWYISANCFDFVTHPFDTDFTVHKVQTNLIYSSFFALF